MPLVPKQVVQDRYEVVRCIGKGERERVLPLYQRAVDELRQYIFHVRPRLVRNRREPFPAGTSAFQYPFFGVISSL